MGPACWQNIEFTYGVVGEGECRTKAGRHLPGLPTLEGVVVGCCRIATVGYVHMM